jgi:hypothetical protein
LHFADHDLSFIRSHSPLTYPEVAVQLDESFRLAAFKKTTNIRWARRGSNIEEVDDALEMYWTAVARRARPEQLSCLLAIVKECNGWLKKKKDKNEAGTTKESFRTRWDTIKQLGRSSLNLALRLAAELEAGTDRARLTAALDYERKKLQRQTQPGRAPVRALRPGYSVERNMYVAGGCKSNPLSASVMHENLGASAHDEKVEKAARGNSLLTKDFEALTVADFVAIDRMMTKLGVASERRHVQFLDKAARLEHIVLVNAAGRCTKANGDNWTTPSTGLLYVMDEYGNMFIGEGSLIAKGVCLNHSSMLSGKAVLCAGIAKFDGGLLVHIDNQSGHYKPSGENLSAALAELRGQGCDLSRTVCSIMTGASTGFDPVTANEVIEARGTFPTTHRSYYNAEIIARRTAEAAAERRRAAAATRPVVGVGPAPAVVAPAMAGGGR